jgi:hypothetical protein
VFKDDTALALQENEVLIIVNGNLGEKEKLSNPHYIVSFS